MNAAPPYLESIERDGFAILEDVVPEDDVLALLPELEAVEHEGAISRRGSVHAVRNLLETVPRVQALARSEAVRALVSRYGRCAGVSG